MTHGARPTNRCCVLPDIVGTRAALSVPRMLNTVNGSAGWEAVEDDEADVSSRHARAWERVVCGADKGTIMRKVKRVTILELVEAVQDIAGSDEEVVAVLTHLLKTRTVRASRPLPVAA